MPQTREFSDRFNPQHGKLLLRLARETIREKLGLPPRGGGVAEIEGLLGDDIFKNHRASFVTLTIDGQLRGCIGSLTATEPVAQNIKKNAINAAFHDPRFQPLSAAEFEQVHIDISILSEPKGLDYSDPNQLLKKLRPGVDGVILRKGPASSTFLPQVWEQLPEPRQFLSHLCMKAGLPAKAWQSADLDIQTYEVQYFKEDELS